MRASDGDGEALARVNRGFSRLTWLYITNGVVGQLHSTFDFALLFDCCVYAVLAAGVGSARSRPPARATPSRFAATSHSYLQTKLPSTCPTARRTPPAAASTCPWSATAPQRRLCAPCANTSASPSYVGPLDNGDRPLFMVPSLARATAPLPGACFSPACAKSSAPPD